jgi:superfamily II DNA or RNA helicase
MKLVYPEIGRRYIDYKIYYPTFKEALAFMGLNNDHLKDYQKKTGKPFPRKATQRVLGFQWKVPLEGSMMIFDEVHKCKGLYTQNARMLAAAKKYKVLGLSATLGDSPRDLRSLGYVIGLHQMYDFDNWTRSRGCVQNKFKGWYCIDAVNEMMKISTEIYPARGARMRVADIPGFPETQIRAESYQLDDPEKYNREYELLLNRCRDLREAGKKQSEILVQIIRFRQAAELWKVPIFIELTRNYIEQGHSVAVFVNYTETREILAKALKTKCMAYGGQKDREDQRVRFQDDKEHIIICQIGAGGVGLDLHDVRGRRSRVSLISPSYNAQEVRQALGRIHRSNAKSKSIQRIVYAAGTIEDKVCAAVNSKIDRISALNDGDMCESDLFQLMNLK